MNIQKLPTTTTVYTFQRDERVSTADELYKSLLNYPDTVDVEREYDCDTGCLYIFHRTKDIFN